MKCRQGKGTEKNRIFQSFQQPVKDQCFEVKGSRILHWNMLYCAITPPHRAAYSFWPSIFFQRSAPALKRLFCFSGIFWKQCVCSRKPLLLFSTSLTRRRAWIIHCVFSADLEKPYFPHIDPGTQSVAKHPWLMVFHLLHIFHQPLRKLPRVLLCPEILNIHPSIISLFNSIKW